MTRAEILSTAEKCVCGQREQDYGSPENNFATIAALWNAYMGKDIFTALDVSMCMALLKIARIRTGKGTADSFVDLAGYAACGGEIVTEAVVPVTMDEVVATLKTIEDVANGKTPVPQEWIDKFQVGDFPPAAPITTGDGNWANLSGNE